MAVRYNVSLALRQYQGRRPDWILPAMTSGFNSDLVLDGVVYHIQTEDRGSITAEIVTQIFREGAVIFTRRTPYPDGVIDRQDPGINGAR